MNRRVQIVRLTGVVLLALAAALFLFYYSKFCRMRMEAVYQASAYTPLCDFMSTRGWLAFLLPGFILLSGILTLRVGWAVIHESILVFGVVLAVALILLCLVAWQITSIPIFSGGRWHY